jgi:hypothetical protein
MAMRTAAATSANKPIVIKMQLITDDGRMAPVDCQNALPRRALPKLCPTQDFSL